MIELDLSLTHSEWPAYAPSVRMKIKQNFKQALLTERKSDRLSQIVSRALFGFFQAVFQIKSGGSARQPV